MENRRRNELIGRAAMAVLAAALLLGGWGLFRAGQSAGRHDQEIKSRLAAGGVKPQRYPDVAWLFYAGAALLTTGGLVVLRYAVGSHRRLMERTPKPAVLWENPEPGTGVHRF